MASSSTSSNRKSFKYDVYLSFRGEDTRKNFVDHLYVALQRKGIHTYKDDEIIKLGRRISDELIGSIEECRFIIIVFSKNYASSAWCLDELVKIMECHKTTDQRVCPVFYDVEPSEVSEQIGSVGKAFAKHIKEEASGRWRQALQEAANLAVWDLKNMHEAKAIDQIVEYISLELHSIHLSNNDQNLIGMEPRINEVLSSLEAAFSDVYMIGIEGMVGVGKTTLARAIFDKVSFGFESISFIENVKEVSKASLSGLMSLQQKILSNVLNVSITIRSVYQGKSMIRKVLGYKKVLIVLDDVDHIDQLEALAGSPNWFGKGSVIIVTTRDEQLLLQHEVNYIYHVNELSDEEANCLFSCYAFGGEIPVKGYKQLSLEVVHCTAGVPLAIKGLGTYLRGRNKIEWINVLQRLKVVSLDKGLKINALKQIRDILELSNTSLVDDDEELFLDVTKNQQIDEFVDPSTHESNITSIASSTSSIRKSFEYDVYLSFRRDDTRKNFGDHLYYALQSKGIYTCKDDRRIKKGSMIGDEVIRSIQDTEFIIIVFSKNYASSSRCLDELLTIMECHKTTRKTIYPVFYDVEPSEVCNQSGAVGEAFEEYSEKEAAGKWRQALQEATDLASWDLKHTANGYEARFIQKLVEEILFELQALHVDINSKIIGMEPLIKEVLSSIETGFGDVRMIGIMGMGGVGKTTLARAIFNKRPPCQFHGKSFVENVKGVSKSSLSNLKSLQEQVLSDLLNDEGITISSVSEGKNMIEKELGYRKVFIVLDNVDEIEQLEALAGAPHWFGKGSIIIITTRDEKLLLAHGVQQIHRVYALSEEEAVRLFSWYAFSRDIPVQGYRQLSVEIVRCAAGLPLAIKVLGLFLRGKNKRVSSW